MAGRRRQLVTHPIRRERELRGWSQAEVAKQIGAPTGVSISRWERGVVVPGPYYRERLCRLFGRNAEELGFLDSESQLVGYLPAPTTRLIGRVAELARTSALLRDRHVRLVTLVGPPGVGKTRLGLAAAWEAEADHPDGAHFVNLAPLTDPALVGTAIRQTLGLGEPGRIPVIDALALHLAGRRVLLVLDNFEHVLLATPLVVELLARCPELRVLVTSRAALRVRAERELSVPPLRLPGRERAAPLMDVPAVDLFVERVRGVVPDFQLTPANGEVVAEICRRLDGLPLALELAAPWIKLLTPRMLLERLERRLALLVDGPLDLPERQRTMHGTMAWSCDLLAEEPRTLFSRLSVFAGSAPLEAVERVCQAAGVLPGDVLGNLAVLVDHSLAQRLERPGGDVRVSMLETAREYGRELLRTSGELASTARAHAEYYAALASRARPELRGAAQGRWLDRLEGEHDNLRVALQWTLDHGNVDLGLRLASDLFGFWESRGHRQEGLWWLERLLAAAGRQAPALRAEALRVAGRMACFVGAIEPSHRYLHEGLETFRRLNDRAGVARTLRVMGDVSVRQGDARTAFRLFADAIHALCELNDEPELASAVMGLGVAADHNGDRRRAVTQFEAALAILRRAGDMLGMTLCLINLGDEARLSLAFDEAQAHLDEAVAISRELEAPYQLGAALATSADLARNRNDLAGSAVRYEESLRQFVLIADEYGIAYCLNGLAWLAWAEGDLIRAARLHGVARRRRPDVMLRDAPGSIDHEQVVSDLQRRLGESVFAAAGDAGARPLLDGLLRPAPPAGVRRLPGPDLRSADVSPSCSYPGGMAESC